jgi:hypothetical protein
MPEIIFYISNYIIDLPTKLEKNHFLILNDIFLASWAALRENIVFTSSSFFDFKYTDESVPHSRSGLKLHFKLSQGKAEDGFDQIGPHISPL